MHRTCAISGSNSGNISYNMIRTNFFFPEQMLDRLQTAKSQLGIPMSEIIRRAIEECLSKLGL